jgi:RNA-directed DNA polymerase
VSKEIFSKMDYLTYQKLRAWSRRRHPKKPAKWVTQKYWHRVGNDNWGFSNKGIKLLNHAETSIVRHVKVQRYRSPFDGDWVYWSTRMGKHPETSTRMATLLKRQKGKCSHCGLYFKDGDLLETDHILPKSKGGKDEYNNLQLLHRHCHDVKTTFDKVEGTHDKSQIIEEPCEVQSLKHGFEDEQGGRLPC